MKITKEIEQEIINDLKSVFPEKKIYKVGNFIRLQGADTITYSFSLNYDGEEKSLILRIYRSVTDRAEGEFQTLQTLKDAGLSVPQPFLWKKDSSAVPNSYMIMEKIEGKILAEFLFEEITAQERNTFMTKFIQELVSLHKINWKKLFPNINKSEISSNPYLFIEKVMEFPKDMVQKYNIEELHPLIEWLEKNEQKCESISLIHGDYHMNNVIVTPKGRLVVIDWANIKLGDYRYDLGFSIVTTSSAGADVSNMFTTLYQTLSGKNIENIEYFMVLSALRNILRCYSAIMNPEIMNENETTKYMFLVEYKTYTQYLVTMVAKITGVQLPTIQNALN